MKSTGGSCPTVCVVVSEVTSCSCIDNTDFTTARLEAPLSLRILVVIEDQRIYRSHWFASGKRRGCIIERRYGFIHHQKMNVPIQPAENVKSASSGGMFRIVGLFTFTR